MKNIPGENGIRLRIEHDLITVKNICQFEFYKDSDGWWRYRDGEVYASNLEDCLEFILSDFNII